MAKVSDFALTRERDYYSKDFKLPIKWTAPEAIEFKVSEIHICWEVHLCMMGVICVWIFQTKNSLISCVSFNYEEFNE